jgi:ribosomal protein S18 acetylase RimI-like enzyme
MKNSPMSDLKFIVVKTPQDLKRSYPVMKELRTNLEYDTFVDTYEKAHQADGYQIVSVEKGDQIVALMGYRFLHDFVHGKHVYIDDLVTTEAVRSQGVGAELLKHAEAIAEKNNCKNLRLCTGIENEQGKKFYERNSWNLRAIVYKKKMK